MKRLSIIFRFFFVQIELRFIETCCSNNSLNLNFSCHFISWRSHLRFVAMAEYVFYYENTRFEF